MDTIDKIKNDVHNLNRDIQKITEKQLELVLNVGKIKKTQQNVVGHNEYQQRIKNNPVGGSYTNKLLNDKSLSKAKVLEEINELVDAIEQDTNKIHEAADVFYHLIMYLEANDVKIEDVMNEINKRKK